jgi:hypothetical protein
MFGCLLFIAWGQIVLKQKITRTDLLARYLHIRADSCCFVECPFVLMPDGSPSLCRLLYFQTDEP